MCKKQTSVSHSSTESEIISLDAGLRLDGLPALELWDLIVSVLGNVSRVSDRSGKPESDDHKHHKSLGSDCFCPWKHNPDSRVIGANPLSMVKKIMDQTNDLKE